MLSLPQDLYARVITALNALAHDPRPSDIKKLHGKTGIYRVRVGSHRIPYTIDDAAQAIDVLEVGDRQDIYR